MNLSTSIVGHQKPHRRRPYPPESLCAGGLQINLNRVRRDTSGRTDAGDRLPVSGQCSWPFRRPPRCFGDRRETTAKFSSNLTSTRHRPPHRLKLCHGTRRTTGFLPPKMPDLSHRLLRETDDKHLLCFRPPPGGKRASPGLLRPYSAIAPNLSGALGSRPSPLVIRRASRPSVVAQAVGEANQAARKKVGCVISIELTFG